MPEIEQTMPCPECETNQYIVTDTSRYAPASQRYAVYCENCYEPPCQDQWCDCHRVGPEFNITGYGSSFERAEADFNARAQAAWEQRKEMEEG